MWVYWKIWFLVLGAIGRNCLKQGGLDSLREGMSKKRGLCFWGEVDTPMHTINISCDSSINAVHIDKTPGRKIKSGDNLFTETEAKKIFVMNHMHQIINILIMVVWTHWKESFKSV